MKKFLLIICAALLVLSGCVSADTSIVFYDDKTIDVNVDYAVERNAGAADEAIESIIASYASQLDEAEIDYETSSDENAYHMIISLRFDDVAEMTSSDYFNVLPITPRLNDSDVFNVSIDENGNLTMNGVLNAETMGFETFISQASVPADKISANISVTLPDGSTQEWSVKGDSDTEVDFSASNIYGEAKNDITGYIPIIIAVVVVFAAAIIIVPKKPKKEENEAA
jgi:hypothetical protein